MKLKKFIDPLPIPQVLKPLSKAKDYTYYEVVMREANHQFHSDLPPTIIWGYEGVYPGPTVEAEMGERVYFKWKNNLPSRHFLPLDKTVHGAHPDTPEVRTVVHLHGGRTEPDSDGYPEAWFTSSYKKTGPFFRKKIYEYSNLQSSRCLWYHDHAIGITRLNIYAGLAGFYLIRDSFEKSLNLPAGPFEIPLMIQDKSFLEDGSLFYPEVSEANPSKMKPSIVPEFFGDTIVVNGKVWPFLEVEPRSYRFRVLNASNSRFFRLYLEPYQFMFQIGTDSGFMEKPISIQSITLAPAERADIIVDFSTLAGKTITLKNNAPAGFPSGKPPEAETTGSVMQFRVTKPLSGKNHTVIPPVLSKIHWLTEQSVNDVRYLELGETKDQFGRKVMLLDNKKWDSPISENPIAGTVEIWNLINTTQDDHPIHLHLVQFQILDRRPFDVKMFKNTGKIKFTGSPILPKRQEKGWKDVSQSPPGMITRIIVPFFPYTGLYVWHCHMLEHEDYEMMRPYQVLPP